MEFVAITVQHEGGVSGAGDCGAHKPDAAFAVMAGDESFKGLVKGKRLDCFRSLGGGARVAAKLASGVECGICGDAGDVACRKEAFGAYTYPKPKPRSFFRHVWEAFANVYLVVLLVCAVVFLAIGIKEYGLKDGWYDGLSIFLAVFLFAAVSALNNHSQAKRFDKLARESENITVNVVRDARRQEVSIFDVVVGDVVMLKIGDIVPADGVILEGHALQVDESGMTGEPHPVEIDAERSPFLTSGVKVVDGYGKMLVTAVGTDTSWGEMMSSENTDPTPLHEYLEGLISSISKISVVVGLFLHSVNIVVIAAIPEGLRLVVTLTLAFSSERMVKENALVRRLSACEAMGSVTAICTDMTGTLTLNQINVTEFWVGTNRLGSAAEVADAVVSLLCQDAGLNTTGSVHKPDNVSSPEIIGSPTEKALLSWAVEELGMDTDALKRKCKVVHVEAFNSDKKRSGVMVRDASTAAVTAHWKGAAEMVLANCSMYVGADGAACELGVDQRRNIEQVINEMAAASLQCIAFAYKQVHSGGEYSKIDDQGLTLLGFVGLKDPCRPDVKSAIEACTKAGISIKMVTGDNVLTARAIAKECGIISDNDPAGLVIEASEFRAMSREQQLEIVDKIRVMARSLPSDKLALVKLLKQKGHVVAVTGDCTNDEPALKEADVGLSMGVHGMELAKDSADIVILNNNFDTVATVIRWGRCIYNNIQKFIQLQLTVYTTTVIISLVSVLITKRMLLTTAQLMWGNLLINTKSAFVLATNTPTKGLMQRPPVSLAPLISNAMWRNLAGQSFFQITVLLALHYFGPDAFGEKANDTMIFNAFMLCQVLNEFNVQEIEKRNVSGALRNKMFLAVIAVTLILQVVMVEVRTRLAGTERLGWVQWGACLAIAAMSWPIGWAIKYIPVPSLPFHEIMANWKSTS